MEKLFSVLVTISKFIGYLVLVIIIFTIFIYIEEEILQLPSDFLLTIYYIGCGDITYHLSIKYANVINNV